MEVLVGSTFGIDVSSSQAYVREAAQDNLAAVASCIGVGSGSRICAPDKAPVEDSSDSSSSIGAPDDSDEEEDDASFKGDADKDEAQNKFRGRRGLSNHFSGKSKSFANLSDVSTANDLVKRENPLNKRRRILIASKWSKKSFYSWANPKSMPLLTLKENDEENQAEKEEHEESQEKEEEEESDSDDESCRFGLPKFNEKRLKSFKTRSCFSLSHLQEHNRLVDEEDHHQN
ncbi:hypothetical protein L484_019844 [Morus notabilis]|uniref:Uncharacterized protein n=1 Tax=Morus notabilis TaxID=981085 RepID=W9SY34_9ROSA|nr:hypothetical protein L484_019844 [Morus notabilis]